MWLQGLIVIVLFVVCFVVGYFVGRNNPVIYDRKKEEINSAMFQSTPPCRGRRYLPLGSPRMDEFQSTPPCRGRPELAVRVAASNFELSHIMRKLLLTVTPLTQLQSCQNLHQHLQS